MMNHFLDGIDLKNALEPRVAAERVKLLLQQICHNSDNLRGIVGQEHAVRRIVQSLMIGEHCLLEGNPGLAKTLAAKTLGQRSGLVYKRVQFVPDLMPSDLVCRERLVVRSDGNAELVWVPGPLFTNIFLGDEINRASPKTQASTLEAMEERQVTTLARGRLPLRPMTVDGAKADNEVDELALLRRYGPYFNLPAIQDYEPPYGQVFIVLGTMNPIEQEGVFPLSEAQLDRFAFKVLIFYPESQYLRSIVRQAFDPKPQPKPKSCSQESTSPEEEHVKTLYFFTGLRQFLVGDEVTDHFCRTHGSLLADMEALVEYTHLRRKVQDDGEESAAFVTTATAENVKDTEVWERVNRELESSDARVRARAERVLACVCDPDYPEVLNGGSPRALLKLIRAVHAQALLAGRFSPDGRHVAPTWEDVRDVAPDILRHRIRLTTGEVALGTRPEKVIRKLLSCFES
jgi:MoxR-like ATPase